MLDAAEFIPAAEQSGLLVSIDRWVLREACRQGQSWVKAGIPKSLPSRIAVNMSALHFQEGNGSGAGRICGACRHGFPRGTIRD